MRERFLIVCGGKETEPNYFEGFRVSKDVKVIRSGRNTIGLVNQALRLKEKDDYDQVWCVFDKDSFPAQDFNQAIELAETNGIRAAYSNEAFELWYLLHYNYHDTAMHRSLYCDKLSEQLGQEYKKNCKEMYDILEPRLPDAIRNASKLLESYTPHNPAQDNPCTTVHLLVDQLNRKST